MPSHSYPSTEVQSRPDAPRTRHHFSPRCRRVRRQGSRVGRVAGRRHRRLPLVLDLDVDPRPVGSRVPDFLEGPGHRAADAASTIAVRQPHQPGHDRREARQHGESGQQVGHPLRVMIAGRIRGAISTRKALHRRCATIGCATALSELALTCNQTLRKAGRSWRSAESTRRP